MNPRTRYWFLALAAPLPLALLADGRFVTWSAAILLALLAVCVATDLRFHKIPNWCTYPAFIWGVAINAYASLAGETQLAVGPPGWGAVGLGQSLSGAAICFFVMFFAHQLARGGAGDVKLATAIGALLGARQGVTALVATYLAAGGAILLWSIWTRGPLVLASALGRRIGAFVAPLMIDPPSDEQRALLQRPVPLAAFFAVGVLAALWGAPR